MEGEARRGGEAVKEQMQQKEGRVRGYVVAVVAGRREKKEAVEAAAGEKRGMTSRVGMMSARGLGVTPRRPRSDPRGWT